MDATRIVRVRPPAPGNDKTQGGRGLAPRASPGPGAPEALPLERWALVALIFGRERAAALLEGLPEHVVGRAQAHLAEFIALSSARRQARVSVEFGGRPDAAVRLRRVMEEAPEALRRALYQRLPAFHRGLFPEMRDTPLDVSAPAAVAPWAERLIREATR